MPLADFINLFDKSAIEDKRISFAIYAPLDRGGKWFFYCDNQSKEDLIKWVRENKCINDLELDGWNEVEILPQDEDSIKISIHFD